MNLLILVELAKMMKLFIFKNPVILVFMVILVIQMNLVIMVNIAELVILMNRVILVNMVSLLIQVDFCVYDSVDFYGLTYKYMILWSRVSNQYVRVDFVVVLVIQTLTASVRISAWTWKRFTNKSVHVVYFWYWNYCNFKNIKTVVVGRMVARCGVVVASHRFQIAIFQIKLIKME